VDVGEIPLQCDWALFCARAEFDPPLPVSGGVEAGKSRLSITHVIERVVAGALPTAVESFLLVAHLDGYGRCSIGLRVFSPSGDDALERPGCDIDRVDRFGKSYLVFRIGAAGTFAFFEEGRYRFELLLNNEVARTAVLPVAVISPSRHIVKSAAIH
jgi:hypothetical protein